METNAGWLFYKHYYKTIDFRTHVENHGLSSEEEKRVKKNNEDKLTRLNTQIVGTDYDSITDGLTVEGQHFELTTQYPGLVTGTGINHESKTTGEFKMGFSFDYTTGMPIISGSSVKGMLRSAFRHTEYIQDILTTNGAVIVDIPTLEAELFDGKINGKYISIYQRDIFFDAIVSQPSNYKNRVFATDSITPHEHPLKDPKPLLFLKVAPGAVFSFRYSLPERKEQVLTPAQRLGLYKQILMDLGIGAKTNVGYGQFTTTVAKKNIPNNTTGYNDEIPPLAAPFLLKDKSFSGTVTQITETHFQISFTADKYHCTVWKKLDKIKGDVTPEAAVSVKITNPYDITQKLACKVSLKN